MFKFPNRVSNQLEGFWSVFSMGPWGIVAGLVVLLIGAWLAYVVLSWLASLFGVIPFTVGIFTLVLVWLGWSAMDDQTRHDFGRWLWLVPFVILFGGLILHSFGVLQTAELSVAQANRSYTLLTVANMSLTASTLAVVYVVFFVIVFLAAVMVREE